LGISSPKKWRHLVDNTTTTILRGKSWLGQPAVQEWELKQEEATDERFLGAEEILAVPFLFPDPEELEL
jgi:hypothetical protein